jgi:hypothetical protein
LSKVLACDRCHTAVGDVQRVNLCEDRETDASGHGYVYCNYSVDLCSDCLFTFFRISLIRHDDDLQAALAKKMRDYVNGKVDHEK